MDMPFEFSEDMDPISGLGGVYERACRAAVCAGAKWFAEHPHAHPALDGDMGRGELIEGVNTEGCALLAAIRATLVTMDDGSKITLGEFMTPAMYYVVLYHVTWIGAFGWNWYVAKMSAGKRLLMEQPSQRAS